jgi:hypothetical protein
LQSLKKHGRNYNKNERNNRHRQAPGAETEKTEILVAAKEALSPPVAAEHLK